jgi:hypothetical protein
MEYPKVSIIIVNWNGKRLLKDCLDSVFRQTYKNYDVILVDNGSTDGSVEFIREAWKQEIRLGTLKIICNDRNYGFAEGSNIGTKHATKDERLKYIVLLNNDTVVEENFLKELVEIVESEEGVGIIQSNVLYPVRGGGPGDRKLVSIGGKEFCISERRQGIEASGTTGILDYNIYNVRKTKGVGFYAGGASLLFKPEIASPPFDPEYFMYSEDVYLSWLARLKGYKIELAEKSHVVHLSGGYDKELEDPKLIFHTEKNRIMNLLLFYNRTTLLKILPLLFSEIFLKNLIYPKRTKSRILAYLWILKNRHKIADKRQSIQVQRKVPDKNILKLMSCKVMTESGAVSKIVNRLARFYCLLLGIKTLESQRYAIW